MEILTGMWEKTKRIEEFWAKFQAGLGMAWERRKGELRCQAGGIYTVDPSLISKKKQGSKKKSLFKNKWKPLLAVPPCCFDANVLSICIHHPQWTVCIAI